MKTKQHLLLFLLISLFACQKNSDLNTALSLAGENREELEKVLKHYQEDPLKYEAACFLISNMPYWYYYSGEELDKQLKQYELLATTSMSPQEITEFLMRKYGPFDHSRLIPEYDIRRVDSAYLVNNIDFAFKVWQEQPWGKNVSFETFCEYVLPYRIGDERLCSWREEIYDKYNHFFDNFRDSLSLEDPLFAAQLVLDSLDGRPIYFTNSLPNTPHVGPQLVEWRSGDCRELADLVIYTLRALGIPCGVDYMVMRGDNNAAHFWNFVLDKNEETYMTAYPDPRLKPATELWNPKGKTYRTTYSLNREMQREMKKRERQVHPTFRNPNFKDVTPVYAGEWNRTLTLPDSLLYDKKAGKKTIYLCSSVRDLWVPITWGTCKNHTISFEDVEGNVIFRLATYDGSSLQLQSDPFLFEKETGNIRYFHASDEMEIAKILFKYHLYNETFIFRMPGGVFEAGNRADFSDADTLHLITEVPTRLFNTVYTHNTKKYRYARFYGADGSHCNLSELVLYEKAGDTSPLTGKVIGTPGCFQQDGSHEYTNVFDGDPYTSFDYTHPSGGWAGIDFGTPRTIEKLVYMPRNRDNFIRTGDEYELYYWKDRKWQSVGRQTASSDSLLYSVPKEALLYLRNHTRGRDERIFEYADEKQIFW